MAIYKIDSNLPTTTKIATVNDMIIEANGKVEQGKFNTYEIDQLYSDLGIPRRFARDIAIGNTVSDYTGWSHFYAESGYSIWKYTVSDYSYNLHNKLYVDNKVYDFKGQAGSESSTTFSLVYYYITAINLYTNVTSEAGNEGGTEFSVLETIDDYIYLASPSQFGGAKFEFETRGSNYTLKVEYFNGAWTELTDTIDHLNDATSNFESDGTITWSVPSDWTKNAVNGNSYYWIRISTDTAPVTVAKVYYLIPYSSVVSLLALSSSQILNEEWAWCSYGQNIYVTFRNSGTVNYEGDYFLTSSSTVNNKQNFFINNHTATMDYQISSFYGDSVATQSSVAVGNLVCIIDDYAFDNADADSFAHRAVGVLQSSGVVRYVSGLVQDVNTVGAGNIIAGDTVYLSTTAGKVTRTSPPYGSNKIQQKIGIAISDEESGNRVDIAMQIDLYPTILV